jgi:hypothetical protein
MDADQATRDRGRLRRIAELWRPLPWWERVVYVLAALLFALAVLTTELSDHAFGHPIGWGEWGTWNRLVEISILLLAVCYPVGVATCCLALRRWSPEYWRAFRRSWGIRAVLVGFSVLYGFAGWDSAVGLATPAGRIPPTTPTWLGVLVIAAVGLAIVGGVVAGPEISWRMSLAKRQQP